MLWHSLPSPPFLPGSVLDAYGGPSLLAAHTLAMCAVFSAVYFLAAAPLVAAILPRGQRPPPSARTLTTMRCYVTAVCHHLVVGPASIYALASLVASPAGARALPYPVLLALPPITLAYLLTDLAFYAVPHRDAEFLLHHSVTLALSAGILLAPSTTLRWAADLMICELSSIPLCVSYFCRKTPAWRGSAVHGWAEATFCVVFTLTRVVNLPLSAYHLVFAHPGESAALGSAGAGCIAALCALQLYWFSKIVPKVALKLAGGGPAADGDGSPASSAPSAHAD